MEPLIAGDPRYIGPYRLVRRLGHGGMGRVFLGRSRGGRLVAVKVVAPELAGDTEFRRRFALEVVAARQVGGFYTAQVVDADTSANPPWLVTAYIVGPSLQQAVRAHGRLPYQALRVLGSGLAEGLAAIHDAGVVHRDLKPGNVILADDGPRVIDFGVARAMEAAQLTTSAIGTPGFMSPEQTRGRHTGPESDVFALACVLVFAATGHCPYGEGRPEVVLYRTLHEEPDLTDVPPELAPFLRACLAKDPAERPRVAEALHHLATSADTTQWLPAAVSEMISEHRRAAQALHGGDDGGDRSPRPPWWRRRRNVLTASFGLAVVVAAAWAVVSVLSSPDTPDDTAGRTPSPAQDVGSTDPCDVIDNTLIQNNQLTDTGTPGGYDSGAERVTTCTWMSAEFGADTDFSYTLAYASSPIQMISHRRLPEEPVDLSGITSASAFADRDSDSCEVTWPTQSGYAAVLAAVPSGHFTGINCDLAADFARSVLPDVPG